MEIPFETNYLYKTRYHGNGVLLARDGSMALYGKEDIGCYAGLTPLESMKANGKNSDDGEFDIVAYKQYNSQSEAIGGLVGVIEHAWDWMEPIVPTETIMTVAEIEKKLGVQNLKIVKE